MAARSKTPPAPFGAITTYRLVLLAGALLAPALWLIERVDRWQRMRATERALAALDDRQLQDIGLSRHEIAAAAARVTGRSRRPV